VNLDDVELAFVVDVATLRRILKSLQPGGKRWCPTGPSAPAGGFIYYRSFKDPFKDPFNTGATDAQWQVQRMHPPVQRVHCGECNGCSCVVHELPTNGHELLTNFLVPIFREPHPCVGICL
jgi:hypothetical protein